MSVAQYLPPILQPPHDPRFTLLNARVGWKVQALSQSIVRPSDGGFTLAPLPGVARSLIEPSGSFGGLVPPLNVALGGDGSIYVLDSQGLVLKRFDPCTCRFENVPCFGGKGSAPRQLYSPGGIAIRSGNLYVCDTGNRRVQIFSLRGFVLRAIWKQPAAAKLVNPWAPAAIAIDGKGRVFVADPDNGGVHRYSASGHWEAFLPGFGVVRALATDCADRLYVVIDGQPTVRIVDSDGKITSQTDPGEVAGEFPPIAFAVDAAGNLYLGKLCVPPSGLAFRPNGTSFTPPDSSVQPLFYTKGWYYSRPLDSRFYRCQWHRIILRGDIPAGTRVTASTFTAEAELPGDQILDPSIPWETNQIATEMTQGEFDCLVANKGGRYLWLRLELRGDGQRSPILHEVQLDFPRISLRRYLPAVFGEEPSGADFTDRFLSIFDTTFRSIESILDKQAQLFDPRSTPAKQDPKTGADFLTWLASWIGISLDRHWPEDKRREWVRQAGSFFCLRGTREGLRRQLLLFLGMEPKTCCCPESAPRKHCCPKPLNCAPPPPPICCWQPPPLVLEHFQLRRWLFVGAGRLGAEAELWGSAIVNRSQLNENARADVTKVLSTPDPYRDPFHVYAHKFSVFVPACFGNSEASKRSLLNLLESERPAHTQYQLEFVEPRFRIGFQSSVGLNTVVGRYPEGITLAGDMKLGRATILSSSPEKRVGPSFDVGRARLGSGTKLD